MRNQNVLKRRRGNQSHKMLKKRKKSCFGQILRGMSSGTNYGGEIEKRRGRGKIRVELLSDIKEDKA